MSDDRYQEHLSRAVPLSRLLRQSEHDMLINACLLHRYGSLPTLTRKGHMTFYLTGGSAHGWYLSVLDGALLEYMEFTVLEVAGSLFVKGGGHTVKVSRFSKKTLARIVG